MSKQVALEINGGYEMINRHKIRDEHPSLYLLNEMANSVNFHNHTEKQCIRHSDKNGNEYAVDFVRDGRGMHYGFNGFGDIFGYYIRATSTKYLLDENRIGINGEVALYLSNPTEKNIFIRIDPALGPNNY